VSTPRYPFGEPDTIDLGHEHHVRWDDKRQGLPSRGGARSRSPARAGSRSICSVGKRPILTPVTGDEEPDRLLTDDGFALLVGMLLDQHVR